MFPFCSSNKYLLVDNVCTQATVLSSVDGVMRGPPCPYGIYDSVKETNLFKKQIQENMFTIGIGTRAFRKMGEDISLLGTISIVAGKQP